jgi:hypothetical protein
MENSKQVLSIVMLIIFAAIPTIESFSYHQYPWPAQTTMKRSRTSRIIAFSASKLGDSGVKGLADIVVNGDCNHNNALSTNHGKPSSLTNQSMHSNDSITTKDKAIVATMTLTAFLAFLALFQATGPGGWRYFLAGGICAATSHGITTPIDVVKVTTCFNDENECLKPFYTNPYIILSVNTLYLL